MFRKSDDVVVVSVNNISTSDSSSVISEASSTASTSSSSSTTATNCATSSTSSSSDRKRKRPRFIRIVTCQICGDDANDHDHYGGIACYSCKAFFRRKIIMKQTLKCVKSNAELMQQPCIITKENRKSCKKCRLEKCFEIGMKATWVMTDEEKDEKKRLQLEQFSNDSNLSSYDERMRVRKQVKIVSNQINQNMEDEVDDNEFAKQNISSVKFTNSELKLIQFFKKCENESAQLYPILPKIKAKLMSSNSTNHPKGLSICKNQVMHLIMECIDSSHLFDHQISWDDTSRLIHHNINDAVEARLKHVINPQLQVKNLMSKDNDSNIWCQEVDKISLAIATLILINDVSEISDLDDSNVVKLNSFRLSHLLHKYLWLKSRPGAHQEFFYSLLKYS